jgi:hypothetical protein
LAALDDAALNLSITDARRAESMAAGRRLAAIAELTIRRLGTELAADRELWGCDPVDSCAAEISCDLLITHRSARAMMHQGVDLRDRIPEVGDLLRDGRITETVAVTASWRTRLVTDPDLLAEIDTDLAATATRWGRYADKALCDAIDDVVARHDPDAVRRFRNAQRGMDVRWGKRDDETGTRSIFGRMSVIDAELSERRITAMIDAVCPDDPRTVGQRRTEAWGVIAAGGDHLPCLCGREDCPAPAGSDARGRYLDILVLTDDPDAGQGVAEPDPDPDPDGEPPTYGPDYDWEQHWSPDAGPDDDPDDEPEPEPDAAEPESACPPAESAPVPVPCRYTSLIAGGGSIPAALLADLRRMGAGIRPVVTAADLTATASYRPTVAQRRFVTARDTTCCFPGCDRPAQYCDLDHTVAYDRSRLTHPGNLKALCRKHHLLKTFWVGAGGWADEQLPDGTIVWTAPSGLTYRAPPGSRIHFPNWDTTTPVPPSPPPATQPTPGKALRMPKRKRSRAKKERDRITAERQRNHDTTDQNPPPF